MGFSEQVYTLPLRVPMGTHQAYERMLDIEMKNLWSPRCWVSRIKMDDNRILIKSNIAKIYVVCTPQDIVFTCKLTGFKILLAACIWVSILLFIPAVFFISEGVLPLAIILFVLIGILMWTLFHQKDNTIKLTKQIIDVIYGHL